MNAFLIAILTVAAGAAQAQHGGYAGTSPDRCTCSSSPSARWMSSSGKETSARALLSEAQVKRYDALRGYSSPQPAPKHRH